MSITSVDARTDDNLHRYLSPKDEMSLAEENAARTPGSNPDTLEVREDSMAIMQDSVIEVRGPLLRVVAVVGVAVLVAVGLLALRRYANGD